MCTSNRAPWELSPAGVHEDMFAHFVGQLTRACPPFELSSERDYRRVAAAQQVSTCSSYCFLPARSAALIKETKASLHAQLWICPVPFAVPLLRVLEHALACGSRLPLPSTAQCGHLLTVVRMLQDPEAGQRRRHYLYPLSQDTDAALEAAWQDATAASPCTADTVSVMFGRKLEVRLQPGCAVNRQLVTQGSTRQSQQQPASSQQLTSRPRLLSGSEHRASGCSCFALSHFEAAATGASGCRRRCTFWVP